MELIPYQQFGKLRISHFYPKGTQLFLDESDSTECAIGRAATEGLAFTYFAWRANEPGMTAEVALDFRQECPPEAGIRILEAIRLPLRPGMSLHEIQQILGSPEVAQLSSEEQGFVRFVCGERWPYFVGCHLKKGQGMTGIIIFRKDYARSAETDE